MKLLVPLLVGATLLSTLTGCQSSPVAAQAPLPQPPYAVADGGVLQVRPDLIGQLSFARVGRSDRQASLEGVGTVTFAPGASYGVRSAVAAYVERVMVTVGQHVERGTALAVLRSPEVARLRGELRRLQVEQTSADDEVERLERLVPQGAASERELITARARRQALQAEALGVRGGLTAANAEGGAGDTFTLRASSAGDVIARTVDPGERVDPSSAEPAFLIGDPSSLVVRAAFAEREAPMLRSGSPCHFVVAALGSERYDGTLSAVVSAVDPATHTVTAWCRPSARNERLRSEMVARVEVAVRGDAGVMIPRGALLVRRDDRVVFVRHGERALERRVVEPGVTLGDTVQIVRGVRDGEEVVTENAVLLDGELDRLL